MPEILQGWGQFWIIFQFQFSLKGHILFIPNIIQTYKDRVWLKPNNISSKILSFYFRKATEPLHHSFMYSFISLFSISIHSLLATFYVMEYLMGINQRLIQWQPYQSLTWAVINLDFGAQAHFDIFVSIQALTLHFGSNFKIFQIIIQKCPMLAQIFIFIAAIISFPVIFVLEIVLFHFKTYKMEYRLCTDYAKFNIVPKI